MKKITDLKVLPNFRLWLRFDDGVEGEIDFSGKPRTGVFAYWNDYENFRRARVGDAGELFWNEEIDFCPDSLWLQVTGQTAREFVEPKAATVPCLKSADSLVSPFGCIGTILSRPTFTQFTMSLEPRFPSGIRELLKGDCHRASSVT
jgi:hypothetical protein